MKLHWYDRKDDKHYLKRYAGSQLIEKFESFSADIEERTFNILATSTEIAEILLDAFAGLDDNFPDLNLRFGWIGNEKVDVASREIPFGKTLIVGKDKDIKGYLKVPNVKVVHISSRTRDLQPHIGFQRHLAKNDNPRSISLGEMQTDLSDSETIIRTAEAIHLHLDALRYEDSLSEHSPITGLDIYTTCKLMRLAGLSKKLQLLCINTVTDTIPVRTAETISTMIWYFLEGQINKEIETMKQKENDIYLVSSNLYDDPIKFVVGNKTGRWWYQHPSTKEYLPCSDKDYKAISMGNLPDAILSLQD